MTEEINKKSKYYGGTDVLDPQQYLYSQFQESAVQAQKIRQQLESQYPQIYTDSGLEFCEFHNERVKHFFCMKHKVTCCRACSEMIHQKKDCIVIDLYEIEDVTAFLNETYKLNQENNCQNQNIEHLSSKVFSQIDYNNSLNEYDLERKFTQNESIISF